jgi:hypothetical protein
MEDNNIVKIEIRNGEFYDFYQSPPECLLRCVGYVFIIARKHPETMIHDFLYIGSSNDLPRLLKNRQVKTFFERNQATHTLAFRVDPQDEMEMMKEEIIEKYPSIKQDLKIKRSSKICA